MSQVEQRLGATGVGGPCVVGLSAGSKSGAMSLANFTQAGPCPRRISSEHQIPGLGAAQNGSERVPVGTTLTNITPAPNTGITIPLVGTLVLNE